jgi:pyruvate,water dikinase
MALNLTEEKEALTLSGVVVCPGSVKSEATIIMNVEDLNIVKQGDIVVIPSSAPVYALALMKASGLVCEVGGKLSHICTVAMEMGIPCVTQVTNATKLIQTGQTVFIDGEGEQGYVTVSQ